MMDNTVNSVCRCGNDTFIGHQLTRHDVLVNSSGDFLEDRGIYDSETPYGPFTCDRCGAEYDELDQITPSRKE